MKKFILFVFSLFVLTNGLAFAENVVSEPVIKEIKIEGNTYLPKETILYYISVKPGEKADADKVSEDIKKLYGLGFFRTIKVEEVKTSEGVTLVYIFEEKPKVSSVILKGNDNFSEDTFKKKASVTFDEIRGKVIDYEKLNDIVDKLENYYRSKGYMDAKVDYKLEQTGNNEVNVVFNIKEGEKAYVCKLKTEGNKVISEDDIKSVLETKERSVWKLRFHPPLVKENFDKDILNIIKLYRSKGYIEVSVDKTPKVSYEDGCYKVTYKIENEGPQYKIGVIKFEGNTLFTSEQLLKLYKELKPGEIYNEELIPKFIAAVTRAYGKLGFIFVKVEPEINIDKKKHLVNITFRVHEGDRAFVRYINIKGNFDTKDRTVRRELDFYETKLFNTEKLERSIRRLYNTGYYDEVNVKPKIVGPNLLDVDIDLKERLTGMFSVGVGYSSATQLTATVSVKKGNLFGTGDSISLSGQFGAKVAYFDLAYSHKWWLNRPQTLNLRVYNRKTEYTSYTSLRQGGSVSLYRRIKKDWNVGIGYKLEKNTISDVDLNATSIYYEEGTTTVGMLFSSLTLDLRDNRFLPRRGYFFSLNSKLAGDYLGGDSNFYSAVADISKHTYLDDFSDKVSIPVVLSAHLKAGFADTYGKTDVVPLDYRFFVGGDTTIRGFSWGEAGPVDENGEPQGANRELVLNMEAGYDLSKTLRLITFFDIGAGWWDKVDFSTLRKSAGIGMRVLTPVGPIRFDVGWKLDKKDGESASEWHFGLGSYF